MKNNQDRRRHQLTQPASKETQPKTSAEGIKTQGQAKSGAYLGWLFQCPPGLSAILKKEMVFCSTLDRKQELFIKHQRNHDLVFAHRVKNPENLEQLRIAEMALRCPLFGRFKISKNQLEVMATEMKELGPRRLVVSVTGQHFQRHDLARWITKEMADRDYHFIARDVSEDDDLDDNMEESHQPRERKLSNDEVWMFCVDEAYYFGVPIIKARDLESRQHRIAERKGSLPPAIAAAMAFCGMPKAEDVILDPTCGSGTLLVEAGCYAPKARLIGQDMDPEAVGIAKKNLSHLAETSRVEIREGDSRKLDIPDGEVNLILANLPFGLQFGSREDNPKLYRELITEMVRVASPEKWRAVLLTSDTSSLQKALTAITSNATATDAVKNMKIEMLFKVKIRGELATATRIQI